jgi:sugar transferase (PEP-CTERM/EpsH1 system associated)
MKQAPNRKYSGPEKPLVVLHVILSLEIGGMEQVVSSLIQHLDQTRYTSVVACVEGLGPLALELQSKGIRVIKVSPMVPMVSFFFPSQLVQVIKGVNPDAVHVHSGCWHKAALAARLSGVKNIIYTEHGRIFPDSRAVVFLDWLYSPLTRHVVAVSDNLADYMCSAVGIAKSKISVIMNGIDVERFRSARVRRVAGEGLRVGIIARLAPVKDIATLVRAVAIVQRRHPNLLLVIVGDGPERNSLESLVQDLGLTSVVTFQGFRRDIPAVLEEIDIFTLSSLSEGTSITLLEAMASGKPVVVTDVGGNRAVVEQGVNGLLVPAAEPESLARALSALADDPRLCDSMALANIEKVTQHYSVQAMACHYEALYRGAAC